MLGFEILFEDGDLLAVAKPPGLLTQAPLGIDSLEVRIKRFLQERDSISGNVYLGVPHRLDRPASGDNRVCEAFKGGAANFEAV